MKILKKLSLLLAVAFVGINAAGAQTRQEKKAVKVAEIKCIVDAQTLFLKQLSPYHQGVAAGL